MKDRHIPIYNVITVKNGGSCYVLIGKKYIARGAGPNVKPNTYEDEMKRLSEMTNEELLNLGADGREILIDLECAHAGIPLLPPYYGPAPEAPTPKTIDAYIIGSFYFLRKSDADAVMAAINKSVLYKTNGYNETERLVKIEQNDDYYYPSIKTKKLPTESTYDECKGEIAKYSALKNQWESKRRAYKDIAQQRKEVIEEIDERIDEAQQEADRKESLTAKFERYLTLADGNPEIAMNFIVASEKPNEKETEFINNLAVQHWEKGENGTN